MIRSPLYRFIITGPENGAKDRGVHTKVDEAFNKKQQNEIVWVELIATGYRARVLRPGPNVREIS